MPRAEPCRSDLVEVPCVWMRGGTSKAAFFHAGSLPGDREARDRLLLAAMGTPDARQIDGIGGGTPLTTKIAIISASTDRQADVDYLFGQVAIGESRIDYSPTCGNILAGVGPFAIEQGLVEAQDPETVVRIRMVNTGALCEAVVRTPGRRVSYAGDLRISGVPTPGAPIELRFRDIAGSSCGSLYPTGRRLNVIKGVNVTCIDNGMPVVLMRAVNLAVSGYESPAELDANAGLKARIEEIRLAAGLHPEEVSRRHRRARRGLGRHRLRRRRDNLRRARRNDSRIRRSGCLGRASDRRVHDQARACRTGRGAHGRPVANRKAAL